MNTKKEQLFRNPDIQPTSDTIAKALGEANDAYMKFIIELDRHSIHLEWRYYTDGKAWLAKGLYKWTGARGGQYETTVFWLSIWDSYFKVTFYIPQKARANVLSLPIDEAVKKMMENSNLMGKLNFYPLIFDLSSDDVFETIFTLADFRKSIK